MSTGAGTYTASKQYTGHACDSVVYELNLAVYVLIAPAQVTTPIAVCGHPVDVTKATDELNAFIANEAMYAENAVVTWQVKNNGVWTTLTTDPVKGSMESVVVRYVITSDCGTIESSEMTLPIEMPNPENDLDMDNVEAVSKYNNRILLINLNAFTAEFGWTPEPEQVSWYKVVGDVDTYGLAGDDQLVGTGHYYNLPEAANLTGSYYALIVQETANEDGCTSVSRTEVLTTTIIENAPQLVPNIVGPNEPMTLKYLNPNEIHEIRVYSTAGELMATYTAEQVSEFILNAAHVSGYYMVDVENVNNKVTLRYVVK
jgi:hypothetical protein